MKPQLRSQKPSQRISLNKPLVNRKLEMYKLVFDAMKHITTLSSGAILLVITMVEKILSTKPSTGLFLFVLASFCISIIAAVWVMILLSVNATEGMTEEGDKSWYAWSAAVATGGFVCGMIGIAAYAFIGLYF